MDNLCHTQIGVPNRTYQALARSTVKKAAQEIGFKNSRLANLELIAAEITSNLVKHTTAGGEILMRKITDEENPGIELISIDNGPGMDTIKMMEDGVSTKNTLGQGLGSIKRISDEFDLYSIRDWGTILLSRYYVNEPKTPKKKLLKIDWRVVVVPKQGERVCGDGWSFAAKGNTLKFMLADGLGHGEGAFEAVEAAKKSFDENIALSPNETLREMHRDIRKTRGAVVNITYVELNNKKMNYCSVGNISAKIISSNRNKSCLSYNGIIGHSIPATIETKQESCTEDDFLVLHSDGLFTRWDLLKYPFITRHDGSILAAALYKDHNRGYDDVSVAVIRCIKN